LHADTAEKHFHVVAHDVDDMEDASLGASSDRETSDAVVREAFDTEFFQVLRGKELNVLIIRNANRVV
jgi:hypothetical protein